MNRSDVSLFSVTLPLVGIPVLDQREGHGEREHATKWPAQAVLVAFRSGFDECVDDGARTCAWVVVAKDGEDDLAA